MAPVICPLCSSSIKLIQISTKEALYTCPSTECVYPIGCPDENMEIISRHYKDVVQLDKTMTVSTTPSKDVDSDTFNDIDLSQLLESVSQESMNSDSIEHIDFSLFDIFDENT